MCFFQGRGHQASSRSPLALHSCSVNNCRVWRKRLFTLLWIVNLNIYTKIFADFSPSISHWIISHSEQIHWYKSERSCYIQLLDCKCCMCRAVALTGRSVWTWFTKYAWTQPHQQGINTNWISRNFRDFLFSPSGYLHITVGVKGVVLEWHFWCSEDWCDWSLTNYSISEIFCLIVLFYCHLILNFRTLCTYSYA